MSRRGKRLLAATMIAATSLAADAPAHEKTGPPQREPSFERADMAVGSEEKARRGKWPHGQLRVGMTRTHAITDKYYEQPYLKDFTLRGFADHVEVWVADDQDSVSRGLGFPYGDCRNSSPTATRITDAQVARLIDEFETRIYPREVAVFGKPEALDGSEALMPRNWLAIPDSAFKGDPDRIMVLVDNIRDEDFYSASGGTLGYVARVFQVIYDRHVLVLDGAFWDQLLGPDVVPTDLPGSCAGDYAPAPHTVEAVLAHEFNHSLLFDKDPAESTWLSEGLANWAVGLMEYADFQDPDSITGFQFMCFLSRLRLCDAGAQNSLTTWLDPGTTFVAGDYGAAHSFVETFAAQHGVAGIRALHDDPGSGLQGVDGLLARLGGGDASSLVHDWSTAAALDKVLDGGAALAGADRRRFQLDRTSAEVRLEHPRSFAGPGVSPNGADFVRLRDASGNFLGARQVDSITFDGSRGLTAPPQRWAAVDGALHVAGTPDSDDAIVREVAVPEADPVLTFRTRYEIEHGWDYGLVQVSTDGGRSYASLRGRTSTSFHEPGARPSIVAQLPGFSGNSGGWIEERVDLSHYAGKTVLLAFRHVTDEYVELPGWWIDEVRVGGTLLSDGTTLADWSAPELIRPLPVARLSLRLIGWNADRSAAFVHDVALDDQFDATISGEELRAVAGDATTVAAIVNYDEPTESLPWRTAPYRLLVNGVIQPGG